MLATSPSVRRITAGRALPAIGRASVAALLLGLSLCANSAFAQVDVTATAGTPAASYTTVKDAFDAVNLGTHQGVISIGISGNTTEIATAALNASGAGGAVYTAIAISPTGGASRTISGAIVAGSPLIDFNGADNVTINGLNTGGNTLTLVNTTVSATSGTSTIRFIGGATSNLITNSVIQGAGTMPVATNGATIFFSTDAVTGAGNDNNTISNNDIGPVGANLPTKAILGNGSTTNTAIGNSGNSIINNNIFDYFGAAVTSAGIATTGGCNAWSITNNRFYQAGTRSWTTGALHNAINIQNNTSSSGAQAFTITGNTIGFASNTQTGAYTLTGSTGKFVGIQFNGITGGTLSSINNNTVAAVSMTGVSSSGTSTTSPFTGILVNNGLVATSNNTFGSQVANASLTFSTTTTAATEVYGIYNFSSDNWVAANNAAGGISVTNLGASGNFLVYGLRANTGTGVSFNATSNIIGGTTANSIELSSTGAGSQVIGMQTANAIAVWNANTVRNLTNNNGTGTTSAASVIGMWLNSTTPNQTVGQNTIFGLSNSNTSLATVVTGIQFTGGAANVVARNLIYGLTTASSSTGAEVNGIRVAGGTTTYRNNMIALGAGISNAIGLAASNGGTTGVTGINASLGTDSFFHNSVYIGGSASAGSGASYAFNGSQTVNTRRFRDNIFFNARSNAGATGKHYAVKINGTTPNPTGLTINNNVYFANGSGATFGFFNSADVANLAAWRTAVGQDAASIEGDPQYNDATNAIPDLHIHPTNLTVVEGNGADVGVTDDFDGQVRSGLTPVDIGADAGNFNGIDLVPPTIAYSVLGNTASTSNRSLAATISDATSGVPTSGTGLPVIYFRKGITGAYASAQGTSAGAGAYNFTIDYALVAGGSVSVGDTIQYYVVAQDAAATPNVISNPLAGASGFSANPPAASTPPTTPNSYNVTAAVSGSVNVGSAEAFTSLTNNNAQGIFKYLNDNAVTGNVVINITSDLAIEDGAVALNEFAAPFTVTIKPTGGVRNVTGAAASTAMIRFNGASRVNIDGSMAGGTDRSLYLENTSTTSPIVVSFRSIGTTPISGNTIKNATVRNGASTSSAVTVTDTAGAAGYFNNIIVQNNDIQKAFIGVFTNAAVLPGNGSGLLITQNNLDTSGVNANRLVGVYVQGADGATVSDNMIGNFSATEGESDTGIWLATGAGNTTVSGNTVTNLGMTLTTAFAPFGIRESSGLAASGNNFDGNTVTNLSTTGSTAVRGMILSSGGVTLQRNKIQGIINNNVTTYGAYGIDVTAGNDAVIKNNFVSDVNHNMSGGAAFDANFGVFGIRLGAGTGHKVYNNSVNLFGPHTGTPAASLLSAAFSISTTSQTGLDVRNNVFANNITGGTTSIAHVSVYLPSGGTSAMNLTWNNNAYYNGTDAAAQGLGQAGATPGTGFFLTSDFAPGATTPAANFRSYTSTLSAAGTNDDSSIAFTTAVPFVSASDLHLQSLSAPESAGTSIAAVTNDIDNDPRPTTKPDIGADELVSNLTITPTIVAFGNLPINTTSSEISVTLANTGAGSLDVTTLTAAAAPFARTGTGTCAATLPITIAPGGSCTLTFTFAPTVAGAANQPLTVTSNGPGSGTITLTGTGTQGNLTITPTTVPFGNQAVGSTSAEMTVTLANTGNASLDVTALTAAAAPFARTGTGTCGPVTITIPASGSCTLTYTFAPSATGAANQVLTVTANAPGSGTITLTGNGTQGNLTITPTSVPFGNQTVNTTSAAMTVTLANTGSASLQVTALTAAAAPFTQTGTGTCGSTPITIAASGSCTLMYTFMPTVPGAANQTLTVTANAPGSGTIALSGTGTAVGAVCTTGMPIEVTASAGLAGPTGYGTLNAGFASINNGIHQGNVSVAVCGDTTEVATALLNASGVGPSVYTTVLVTPSNGGARTISGSLAAPLVDLNGADNVTIDGLNAGGNALTFANASTAATAGTSTIRFIGGATNNMVMNTTLLGSSTTTLATVGGGTVYFADDAVTTAGNDNNTIATNNIGPAGSNLPNKAIFGLGTFTTIGNANSGVVINNNNIYDFFNVGSSVSGIYVANGNDAWTISGNRFYQTAARTFTVAIGRYAGITLSQASVPRGSFTVISNVIGFGAADGTGTTTISGLGNEFRGIDAPNVLDTVTPTSIQGNTISGINQTSNRASTTSTNSTFAGMQLGNVNGFFDVGGIAGNTIGSLDGSSTIVINGLAAAATAPVLGIYDFSFTNGTISNNNIGAITIQGTGATLGFRGILVSGTAAQVMTMANNTIGGATAAGAIVDSQSGANAVYAVQSSAGNVVATGNTVRNITGNGNGASINVGGLLLTATGTVGSTIARNTVHSLTDISTGATAGAVYGIDLALNTAPNLVERNLVHSQSVTSTATYQLFGLIIRGTSPSTTTVQNNMIRLGHDAAGTAITSPFLFIGIRDSAGTGVANSYYHNSVYVGGAGVVGGAIGNVGSYAFNSDVVNTTRNFQDNIFWNARSNAAPGSFHVAARYGGTGANPTGLTASNNDILATGTDGFVGLFAGFVYPDLATFQTATGQDANSFSADPQFIAPNGSAATGDLHISPTIATPIEGTGLLIASVTNDFDGQTRAGLTPTDVGADAGNFVPQIGNLTITPTSVLFGQIGVGMTSAEMTVTLANNGTGSLQVTALTAAAAPFARTATGTCSATTPITIAAGGSCTLTYTFSPTSNGPFNQTLTVTANAPGSGTIALSGTGIQGNLSITPTNVAFGNQTVGTTSAAMAVTFTNTGNASLMVTALTAPASPFATASLAALEVPTGFVNCGSAPFALAAGASCSVGYTFSPTATGLFTQMLTATTDGLGGGTITLSGTGVQGALTISPTTVDFGNQSVGIASAASTVTLSNTGNATLNVTTLTPATTPFARLGGTCSGTPIAISAGGSCTLTYTFSPTAAGPAMQTLTVTSDAPGSGTITLMGVGVQGTLVVSPTTVNFGSPDLFTTTAFKSVTLTNTGSGSLQVNSLTFAAAPFVRTTDGTCGNSLPITLAAGASCTLTYKFAPTTAGVQSQVFTVSNNGTGGSGSFTLTGTGVGDRIFQDGFDGPVPPEAEL